MAFDFITEFKKLCAQLQKEDVLVYLAQAKAMVDKDQELQEMIGKFNLAKYNLNAEMMNPEADDEKLNKLDLELNTLYEEIMANETMVAYNDAAADVDHLTKHIQAIITTTVNGGDPMTVELPEGGCTGSCSSCSGCH
ncbi:MAG: YlbF family regulator [Oscillospiraceae bacterium]|nr:YlbF family regulator [Oscillospiraceae bacterium]MBR2502516.1 YlbF family regulator [Oscillospiraceae bacterium]